MRAKIQKVSKYAPSVFQGRFDFGGGKREGSGFSLTLEHPLERICFRGLLFAIAALAICYALLVGSSILNVIARKEALRQSASSKTIIAELEREYFAATEHMGPEDGARLGLSPVSRTTYVRRPGNAATAATLESNDL